MKIIAVEDAVGMTLWQDMTQIIPKEKNTFSQKVCYNQRRCSHITKYGKSSYLCR